MGLDNFAANLRAAGSDLILRSGPALDVLQSLITETGAKSVYWTRAYDPKAKARDTDIKTTLKTDGIDARSFGGHLMFEPWTAQTKTGGFYKVYTPFWKSVKGREVDAPLPTPARLPAPTTWPTSEDPVSYTHLTLPTICSV